MYYPKSKVIFIAINKSGSSSALTALNKSLYNEKVPSILKLRENSPITREQSQSKHAQAFFYLFYLGVDKYKECFSFSIVRNPFDRLVSQFLFQLSHPSNLSEWIIKRKWFQNNGQFSPSTEFNKPLFKKWLKAMDKGEIIPHGHWKRISQEYSLPDI